MKRKDLTLRHGGLMRCCTSSFFDWASGDPDKEAQRGEKIECKYEGEDTMQVDETGTYVDWVHKPVPPGARK